MNQAIVIRGVYSGKSFIPSEPMPTAEGAAELIVYPRGEAEASRDGGSIFDLLGKAPRLRSAEEIDNQIRREREAWDDR